MMDEHTHTRLTVLCPGLPGWAGTRKVKSIWILLKQETVSGSGISWAICKSAPRSRQITTPAPHHSIFLQAGCPSCRPTNSVKALKAMMMDELEIKLFQLYKISACTYWWHERLNWTILAHHSEDLLFQRSARVTVRVETGLLEQQTFGIVALGNSRWESTKRVISTGQHLLWQPVLHRDKSLQSADSYCYSY